MVGSLLSNLLLVLGMCFFFGGLKYKFQVKVINNIMCNNINNIKITY